jgi:hypothetical protein
LLDLAKLAPFPLMGRSKQRSDRFVPLLPVAGHLQ